MYFYENHQLLQYYAIYDGQLFKTEQDYKKFIEDNGLKTIRISYFRLSKFARKAEPYPEGRWVEYDAIPGTIFPDERDFSRYYFNSEADATEVIKSYYQFPDGHASHCFFQGIEGEINPFEYKDSGVSISAFNKSKQNKQFAHFIISYLPDDPGLRAIRLNAHKLQIKNIKRITPNTKIHIVAQNYKDDEYINDPQIEYKKYKTGIGAGKARNECLKWLYNSDFNWGIINDDDIYLKESDSAINFFKDLEENPEPFIQSSADVIFTRAPEFDRWKYGDVARSRDYSKNWILCPHIFGNQFHWAIFRNLKKFYGKEEYQNENINPIKHEGFDDIDFCLNLEENGYHLYHERTLQRLMGCMEEEKSVCQAFTGNYIDKNLAVTRGSHIMRNPDGSWNWDEFNVRIGAPQEIIIPRTTEVDVWNEIVEPAVENIKQDYLRNTTVYTGGY